RSLPALAALLDALGTADSPALLLLDDCQWADEMALKLLGHWHSARATGGPILVVASFRSEEAPAGHLLRKLEPSMSIARPPPPPRRRQVADREGLEPPGQLPSAPGH